LELLKGPFNFLGGPAFLIDRQNALFEIHARLDAAENVVRGSKDATEKTELLAQQLKDPTIRCVALV